MLPYEGKNAEHRTSIRPVGTKGGTRSYDCMQTFMGITGNHFTAFHQDKDGLLEYILSPSNLNLAYK